VDFSEKAVLVTGATRGIGTAIAKAFARAGAHVTITARELARGWAVRQELEQAGATFDVIEADLSATRGYDEIVAAARERLGRLDVLVNNAAVIPRDRAVGIIETTDDEWFETMTVNVDAVFGLSQAAARVMKDQGAGTIVNISSEMGVFADAVAIPYAVSKAAVIQMTRAMALDLAPFGIRVNAVAPGETRTAMMEEGLRARGIDVDEGLRRLAGRVPLKRIASVDEVAASVLFIASDAASYITGAVLAHDGGTTATGPGGTVADHLAD
jgi:NAD(P)-dependent dehydrogenase (short-subunit alcohol dehydrogenase family)